MLHWIENDSSVYSNLELTEKRWKLRRDKRKAKDDKNEQKDGKSYETGAFWHTFMYQSLYNSIMLILYIIALVF